MYEEEGFFQTLQKPERYSLKAKDNSNTVQNLHSTSLMILCVQVIDKSLLWLVHFPHTSQRRDLSIMYPGNSEPITICREVYQINQVLSKSVSTSSVLSWYMGNVHRSVPLMLPPTRIHNIMLMYCNLPNFFTNFAN